MKHLLTPKLDLVFKLLFTRDTAMLLDLVNTILASPEPLRLRDLEVTNPTILPDEDLQEKFIVLDIRAVDDRERQYDIEIQVRQYAVYPERAVYYLSKLYAGQLEAGKPYHTLKPVIGIHFLDYDLFSSHPVWQWAFEWRDRGHPTVRLTDHLLLHLVELPKFERLAPTPGWGHKLFEWLHFLNHAHEEGEDAMQTQYTNPAIKRAFRVLEHLSADEETRRRAEIRERALRDEVSLLAEAREEGREEGLRNGIDTMLQEKFGEAGLSLAQEVAELHDINILQDMISVIMQASTPVQVKKFLASQKQSRDTEGEQ